MDELNFIGSVKLDLNFFSESKSDELQDKISNLFNDKISYELNELFNSVSKNTLRKYDVIELNIGEISYNQLNNELPSKIISALSDKIFFNSGTLITNIKEDVNYQYYYELLEQFIKTGQISSVSPKNYHNVNDLLNIVLTNNSAKFIQLLYSLGEKENIKKRIVYQFEITSTLKIINAIEPQKFDTIITYLSGIKSIQDKEKIVQTQAHEFERANLLFVLTYLLRKRGSVFNTKSFIKSQIKQMAAHYNMAYNDWLLLMFQSAKKVIVSGSEIKIVDFIRTIFVEDFLSNEERKTFNNNEEIEKLTEDTSNLKKFLLHNSIIYFLENGIWPEKQANIELSEVQKEFGKIVRSEKGLIEKVLKPNLIINRAKHIVSISTKDTYEFLLKNINDNSYNFIINILQLPIEKESRGFNNYEILKEAILFSLVKNKSKVTNNKKISIEIISYLKQNSNFDFTLFFNEIENLESHFIYSTSIKEFIDLTLSNKNKIPNFSLQEKNITKRERQDVITILWNEFKLKQDAYPNTITQKEFRTLFYTIGDSYKKKEFVKQAIEVLNKKVGKNESFIKANTPETHKEIDTIYEFEKTHSNYDHKHSIVIIKEFINSGKLPWWFKNDGLKQLKLIAKQVFIKEQGGWLSDIFHAAHDKKNIVLAFRKLFTTKEFYNKFIFDTNFNTTSFDRELNFITNKIPEKVKIDLEYLSILFYANQKKEVLLLNLKKSIANTSNKTYYWELIKYIANSNKKAIHSSFLPWLIQNLLDTDLSNESYQYLIISSENTKNYEKEIRTDFIKKNIVSYDLSQKKALFYEYLNEINTNSLKAEVLLNDILIKKSENTKEETDYRLFLINSLKNERIKSSIFNNTTIIGIQTIIQTLFTNKYMVLVQFINDLDILITELKLFDEKQKASTWLYLNTISFLIANEHNQISLANYIKYIVNSIKKQHKISKTKIVSTVANIYSRNKLKTFLPFIVKEIERTDLIKKEKRKKINEEKKEEEKDLNNYVFVDNVGIVILWPFFEHLFKMFDLLEDAKFVSFEKKEHAICLLHYLATGKKESFEHELTFEKILCNFPRNSTIKKGIKINVKEKKIINNLMETAVSRWSAIGETSVEGLRESFFKRKGKVVMMENDEIVLFVEKKPYDMLIDRLPWSITTIRLPWLEKYITVNWR